MNNTLKTLLISITAFSLGWLGHGWWSKPQAETPALVTNIIGDSAEAPVSDNKQAETSLENTIPASTTYTSALTRFNQYLHNHRYQDALALYQQQQQINAAAELKEILLIHLQDLLNQPNDFTELTDTFLSVYYDDIDILLLLATFNDINGAFMESINIYQLANTYAYTESQKQKLFTHFNTFVKNTDRYYNDTQDWFALSNFYTHIDTSGLMTPTLQYQQALTYLRNGQRDTAINQLENLQDNNSIGTQAKQLLTELLGNNNTNNNNNNNPWQDADIVSLQQVGNQYLVDLGINRNDTVTLLIDTGASMTTLSKNAFNNLNSRNKANKIGTRLFQTANGTTKGTVYTLPELSLGPYQMNNMPIAVLDFSMSSGIDGLLGMNVLGQYRFQIDQDNSYLLLLRK